MSGGRTHLAAALRWTGSADGPGRAAVLGAMLGTGGPAALAAVAGDLGPGMAAALGGLMIGGVPVGDGAAAQVRAILGRLVPAVAATITVAVLARDGGWADAVLVALAGGAALVGGISRPLAAATTRFVLFLIIAAALPGTDPGRSGVTLLILAGAVWASVVALVVGVVSRSLSARSTDGGPEPAAIRPSRWQLLRRWLHTLRHPGGWQYALRLAGCLAAAGLLDRLWPGHHLSWIGLTVALLIERPVERYPVRLTQRALGTALGVVAAGAWLLWHPPGWAVVAGVVLLAGIRPWASAGNYLLYSAAMTPLVIAILDAGGPTAPGVLVDRMLATLAGTALVLAANRLALRYLPTLGT